MSIQSGSNCRPTAWPAYGLTPIFQREDVLEPGDIRAGLSAGESVGDDRIQITTTGRVNAESSTHGTSEQRVDWFNVGYRTGDPAAGDTFNTDI